MCILCSKENRTERYYVNGKAVVIDKYIVMAWELTFLGTGSAYPSPTRGASCIVLKNTEDLWMFDCGEGSQVQVMKSNIKPGKISKIFITHLHGDHMFGLPGMMCTISQNSLRSTPIEIYGPEGLRKFLRVSLELSRSLLGFDYVVHELQPQDCQYPDDWQRWKVDHSVTTKCHPNEKGGKTIKCDEGGVWKLFTEDKLEVSAVWLKHRIPSFGFSVQEKPLPGKLDAEKLVSLGLKKGPDFGRIKKGETVTLPSGEKIRPEDVIGPARPGRKVVILGDSCDSKELKKIGCDADVVVHEATLQNDMKDMALEKGHSTPEMAASLVSELKAKHLILTHFSQRYKPVEAVQPEDDEEVDCSKRLRLEATEILRDDQVFAADDFMTYVIPLKNAHGDISIQQKQSLKLKNQTSDANSNNSTLENLQLERTKTPKEAGGDTEASKKMSVGDVSCAEKQTEDDKMSDSQGSGNRNSVKRKHETS